MKYICNTSISLLAESVKMCAFMNHFCDGIFNGFPFFIRFGVTCKRRRKKKKKQKEEKGKCVKVN